MHLFFAGLDRDLEQLASQEEQSIPTGSNAKSHTQNRYFASVCLALVINTKLPRKLSESEGQAWQKVAVTKIN